MVKVLQKIKYLLKQGFDRIKDENLKQNILQAIPFWVASLITGLFSILYAKAFGFAEGLAFSIFHYKAWLLFIVSPLCFIGSWWIVKRFSPYARGSGIPQVMAAIELATPKNNHLVHKLLSIKVIIVKVCSSIILVLGGGAVGREGPTIQIAGSVFRAINRVLPNWWPKISRRNMIMTGAAAGLAAAFNTPLGGIMFAIEELTKTHISYFKTAIFTAVIIAGLTAQSLMGPYLYLGYPVIDSLSHFDIFWVMIVAIAAGLLGSGMAKIILLILQWKRKFTSSYQHIFYLLACSFSIAALAYFVNESVLCSGKDLMATTLFTSNKYCPWYFPLLRIAGPVLSFTTNAAGGVFAPGLSAGASIGSVISSWLSLAPSDTNLMILAGMVAFLTGITRSPFTSAILVLEMTDRHSLILHLMLAGIVASIVSIVIDKHSFYDHLKKQYLQELLSEEDVPAGKHTNANKKQPKAMDKILVIEDEPKVASFIKRGLEEHAFEVDIAYDGRVGQTMALNNEYAAIILDINLPHINGFDLCKGIRSDNLRIPILMLTALGTTENKLSGFDVGADDYLVKPFEFRELMARLKALIKRSGNVSTPVKIISIADLELNISDRTVKRSGKSIALTAKEYALLEYLLLNKGRVMSKVEIAERIWDITFDSGTNVIEVYINFLRRKIDKDYSPKLIHTQIGMGYVLKEDN